MILSMQGQAFIFLTAVLTGAAAGGMFDVFRILRKIIKHGTVITQIEDIIFWVLASLLMFYMMFTANNGEIRVYTILGVFLGMTLYFNTISRLVIKLSYKVIELFKKLLRKLAKSIIIKIQNVRKVVKLRVKDNEQR